MANCANCGAPLREGANFCGACGVRIEAPRFCTQCGQSLKPGENFCTQCGAPADGPAPVPAAPTAGRAKKPDYPDVRGFYGKHKAVSAGDEALVWCDNSGYKLYCLERDWTLHSCSASLVIDVIQTKDAVLALAEDSQADSSRLILKTYDKQLSLLSEKTLCDLPIDGTVEFSAFMTQFDLFVLQHTEAYNAELDQDISTDISLRRIDPATGEIREWKWDRLEWEGWTVRLFNIKTVDGEQPYLSVDLYKGEDQEEAILIFDPQTGGFSCLWQSGWSDGGRPMFFDWEKRIIWTHPTKAEAERRSDLTAKSLVARRIAPNAPILSSMPVWKEYHGHYFTYFDGQRAYYAPSYYEFFAYIESGDQSEDWNPSGHGRAETAVVWPQAGKIVMDLMADYYYTVYPLEVAKPSDGSLIPLRE